MKARKGWRSSEALGAATTPTNRRGWAGRPALSGFLTKSLLNNIILNLSAAEVFEFKILTLRGGEGVIEIKEDPRPVVIFLLVSDVLGVGSPGGSISKNFFYSTADVPDHGTR